MWNLLGNLPSRVSVKRGRTFPGSPPSGVNAALVCQVECNIKMVLEQKSPCKTSNWTIWTYPVGPDHQLLASGCGHIRALLLTETHASLDQRDEVDL